MAALEVVKRRLDDIGIGRRLPRAAQPQDEQARAFLDELAARIHRSASR